MDYPTLYRWGVRPWERYVATAEKPLGSALDGLPRTGRALDIGCGRGLYAALLAARGWEVVGVDAVPRAVDAARAAGIPRATFVVGDATDLESLDLGRFDLFLDVGCIQGLSPGQRHAQARGMTALAAPGAVALLLEFGPSRFSRLVDGVSQEELCAALTGWDLVSAQPASTRRLGWPMNRSHPQWYRFDRF